MFSNKNEIKKFIKYLNKEFSDYNKNSFFSQKYSDYSNHNEPAFWYYSILNLSGNLRIEFRRWGSKPFFLVLFKGNKILLELDISRIILNAEQYSLYLNTPTNKNTLRVYKSNLKFIGKLPIEYITSVKTQKKKFNSGFVVKKSGFKLAENLTKGKFADELIKLLDEIVKDDIKRESINTIKSKKTFSIDDAEAEEGYQSDKRYLYTKRNAAIVKNRKEMDKHTCKICGFHLKVNGKQVIECHHLKPLGTGQERVTNIQDLVSICPTCHRIAHLKRPPYTIEAIKKILNVN